MKLTRAERRIVRHTRIWDHADMNQGANGVITILQYGFFDYPGANLLDTWRSLGLITERQQDATNAAREAEEREGEGEAWVSSPDNNIEIP